MILNLKISLIIKRGTTDYISLKDENFLKENEKKFIDQAKNITDDYKCVQLFTNDVMLLYLLKKPSCTKFYYPIVIGSEKNQMQLIKNLNNSQIIISDTYKHNFSPNFRLIYLRDYINNHYSDIYSEDVWIIKKEIIKNYL